MTLAEYSHAVMLEMRAIGESRLRDCVPAIDAALAMERGYSPHAFARALMGYNAPVLKELISLSMAEYLARPNQQADTKTGE